MTARAASTSASLGPVGRPRASLAPGAREGDGNGIPLPEVGNAAGVGGRDAVELAAGDGVGAATDGDAEGDGEGEAEPEGEPEGEGEGEGEADGAALGVGALSASAARAPKLAQTRTTRNVRSAARATCVPLCGKRGRLIA